MRRFSFGFVVALAFLVIVAACAPKTAPTPPAAPAPPSAAPAPAPVAPAPTPAAIPTPTAADEWQKVVAAAKQEGKVSLYTFGFTGDMGQAVAQAFEQAYGIKVETVTGVGTVLMERIKSEHAAGKYLADTLDSAVALVNTAKERGLIQSWGNLPIFAEQGVWSLYPQFDKEGYFSTMGISRVTPQVNTTLVKPGEEPKALKDMLDPKWKGKKIAIGSPVTDPVPIYWHAAKIVGDDYYVQLAKNELLVVPTVRDAVAVVARGEAAINFAGSLVVAAPVIARGAPMRPIELAEGILSGPAVTITMVKNAPHPNAARLFANWIVSKEGQMVYHKAASTEPLRNDVPNYLPPAATMEYKKVVWLSLENMLQVSKLQREGTVAKLLGIEK